MGVKIILSILTVMLTILLVFNAFGIPYATNDFMGTMVTVENGLGQVSDFALKAFDKVKEFVLSGVDLLDSIYNATLGKLVTWLDSAFEKYFGNSLFDLIVDLVKFIKDSLSLTTGFFDYISNYGFDIFSEKWQQGLSLFNNCLRSSDFWEDYDKRMNFKIDLAFEYINAVVYGEKNSFSYVLDSADRKVFKLWNERFDVGFNEIVWCSTISNPTRSEAIIESPYYFYTVNLSYDNSLFSSLPSASEYVRFYYMDGSLEFPIYNANFKYYDENYYGMEPIAFRLVPKIAWSDKVPFSSYLVSSISNNAFEMEFKFYRFVEDENGELALGDTYWVNASVVFAQCDIWGNDLNSDKLTWLEKMSFLFLYSNKDWYCYPGFLFEE